MRILISGDWHIRANNPRRRVDNYMGAQADKVRFLLETAQENECKYIIQPGDLTEHYPHPRCPYRITQWYIREFLEFLYASDWQYGSILTIPGQHDLVNHNDLLDTPMMTMASAQVVTILGDEFPVEDITNGGRAVHFYGHTFGTPMPEPRETEAFKILVTHQMVSDRDYWNGSVRFTQAGRLMHTLRDKYDLIICGDNHNHFTMHELITNMELFNCGSLMRATIAQRDHEPVAYVYDIDTRESVRINIPIQPASEVFSPDPDPIVMASRSGVDMTPFVEQLRAGRHNVSSMNYVETLWRVAEARRINNRVKAMIEEDLRNAYNETARSNTARS